MNAAVPLQVVDRWAARLSARSRLRQQERDGQLPNPPLQRSTAGCHSGSMVNTWSRRRGLGPRTPRDHGAVHHHLPSPLNGNVVSRLRLSGEHGAG
jgi:hypothetical protein